MLYNPLPIEVKIVNLVLMHQGTIAFEAFPTTFSLRTGKDPLSVNLLGVPKDVGELTITGYECTVLGIPSKVHLQTISNSFPSDGFTVQVVKALPQVQVSLNRIQSDSCPVVEDAEESKNEINGRFSPSSINEKTQDAKSEIGLPTSIFYGEEAFFEITLTNISNIKARILDITWTSNCQLNDSACIIQDSTNFSLNCKETKKILFTILGMPLIKSASSRKKADKAANILAEGNPKGVNDYELFQSGDEIEFQFKITYATEAEYSNPNYHYREVLKPYTVTIMPSAIVTKWDVLPSESSNKNFLVLDITNCSCNEMDLMYADSKKLVIEPSDVCRIPLPIDRFALPETAECNIDIQKSCLDIIKTQINVQWTISSDDQHKVGRVLLDNILLTDKMIENLELLPTSWGVMINDESADKLTDTPTYPVGKAIKVNVKLESGFQNAFKGQIGVEFYVHGSRVSVPDTCVITQKESRLQLCNPGSVIEHSTIILPLIQGKFEIECMCKIEQRTSKLSGNIFSNVTKYPPIVVAVK